jgi:hypothetical protein
MGKNIVWMSVADGSWGGCAKDDLLIVDEDNITTNEWNAIHDAEHEGDVYEILLTIQRRANEQ